MQLILNTFGASLRKKDNMFLIRSGDRRILMSPRKVQTIWLATGVHLSTDAIRLALEHHVDIALLDKNGSPYGRFWHARLGSTNLLRRRLLEVAESEEGVRLACEWIRGKIGHQADLLRDLARTRPDRAEALEVAATKLDKLAGVVEGTVGALLDDLRGSLMGVEGVAGREYFAALSLALPDRFRFQGRSRSPAKDEFNALLNYAYGVLYSLVERACLLTGLDPCSGLLHTDRYNKRSLVFDLIELFRIHAERVVVNLFASRRVKQDYFDQKEGGFRLNADGRILLLGDLNDHLDRMKQHGRRRLKIRDTIVYECQRLAGRLLNGLDVESHIDMTVFDLKLEMSRDPGEATVEPHEGEPTTSPFATDSIVERPDEVQPREDGDADLGAL